MVYVLCTLSEDALYLFHENKSCGASTNDEVLTDGQMDG